MREARTVDHHQPAPGVDYLQPLPAERTARRWFLSLFITVLAVKVQNMVLKNMSSPNTGALT